MVRSVHKEHYAQLVVFDAKGKILQKSDYYPFGLSIARDSLPLGARLAANRYLYNEKELQVGSGYLDYGARMYMPEVGRWGMIDPLSEGMNTVSPFAYGFNNPVLYIDINGLVPSTHTDEDGYVVKVYDDGDLGVYKHDGKGEAARAGVEKNHNPDNTSAGGVKMGESIHSLSFADQSLYNRNGKVEEADIRIDFKSSELTDRVNSIINSNPSIRQYAAKAGTRGVWDIKSQTVNGSLLYGKYASPRDAGNFAAGAIAAMSGIESIIQFGYGAYNLSGNSKPLTAFITFGVSTAIVTNPPIGLSVGYLISKFGEDKLTQKSIDLGKEYINKR